MAKLHLIEHVGGGKWLASWGFIASQERAMQFSTEQDAKQYLQDNPNLKEAGHKHVHVEIDDVTGGRFAGHQARTDYDPWGHNRHER